MMKIAIDIDETKCIPSQSLEGKVGYLASIGQCVPQAKNGDLILEGDAKPAAMYVLLNYDRNTHPVGVRSFSLPEFQSIMDAYGVTEPSEVVGKPVISIYDKHPHTAVLEGIVPMVSFKFQKD